MLVERKGVLWLGLALLLAVVPAVSAAASKLPEVSPEGLRLMKHTKLAAVYMKEGADFSGYDKVAILDCYVAFKKNWKRDLNAEMSGVRVSDEDMTRIKSHLAAEFKKVFTKELTKRGETVVTSGGSDVLVLRPAIINLDVQAPDTMQPDVQVFSSSAGQMTLLLELYDSVTSDLLARVMDPEAVEDLGGVTVRNDVTNTADADRVLRKWADTLGKFLEHARSAHVDAR